MSAEGAHMETKDKEPKKKIWGKLQTSRWEHHFWQTLGSLVKRSVIKLRWIISKKEMKKLSQSINRVIPQDIVAAKREILAYKKR